MKKLLLIILTFTLFMPQQGYLSSIALAKEDALRPVASALYNISDLDVFLFVIPEKAQQEASKQYGSNTCLGSFSFENFMNIFSSKTCASFSKQDFYRDFIDLINNTKELLPCPDTALTITVTTNLSLTKGRAIFASDTRPEIFIHPYLFSLSENMQTTGAYRELVKILIRYNIKPEDEAGYCAGNLKPELRRYVHVQHGVTCEYIDRWRERNDIKILEAPRLGFIGYDGQGEPIEEYVIFYEPLGDSVSRLSSLYALSYQEHKEVEERFGKATEVARLAVKGYNVTAAASCKKTAPDYVRVVLDLMLELFRLFHYPLDAEWVVVVTTDLNLTNHRIACANIGKNTLFLHPHFFNMERVDQMRILYYEMLECLAKAEDYEIIQLPDVLHEDIEVFRNVDCEQIDAFLRDYDVVAYPVVEHGSGGNDGTVYYYDVYCREKKAARTFKCLVLDCDGILWPGIAAETDLDALEINMRHNGRPAFGAFQWAVKYLGENGVILAINSKNELTTVLNVLDNHPDMHLRASDFTVIKANWDSKVANLKEIAQELNIGLDSIVFVDDDERERELVRNLCPEVFVPDLSMHRGEWGHYLKTLFEEGLQAVTEEDKMRTKFYRDQNERAGLKRAFNSDEDFFRSLNMNIAIRTNNENADCINRISKLTHGTNQFNLTDRRYSPQEIKDFINRSDYKVITAELTDNIGTYGIIGLLILKQSDESSKEWEIDTFCLSCRAMAKHVEDAFIYHVMRVLKADGATNIKGIYVPTEKNKPLSRIYERLGFREIPSKAKGDACCWLCDLSTYDFNSPDWIKLPSSSMKVNFVPTTISQATLCAA